MTGSVQAVNGATPPPALEVDGPPPGHPAGLLHLPDPPAGAPVGGTASKAAPAERTPTVIDARCMADVEAVPVVWLWRERIPTKLVVAAGPPGVGKSQFSMAITAIVTTAGTWPDGTPCEPAGSVVLICGEDDAADTIKPRLLAAGADVTRVHVVDGTTDAKGNARPWLMEDGVEPLDALCERIEANGGPAVRLVVIDPVTAYVGSKDGHSTSDVRGLLAPLMALADRRRLTVLAVSHLNKAAGTDAMSRVTGSGAYVAASRVSLVFGPHPDEEGACCIAVAKTNLSREKSGIGYRVVEEDTGAGMRAPRLEWLPGVVDIDADTLLSAPRRETDADLAAETAKGDAARFVLDLLADGPVRSPEVFTRGDEAGIAKRTLERAKVAMHIRSVRIDGEPGWWWTLPERRAAPNADIIEKGSDTDHDGAAEPEPDDAPEKPADRDRHEPAPVAGGGVGGVGGLPGEGCQDRQERHPASGVEGGGLPGGDAPAGVADDVERL